MIVGVGVDVESVERFRRMRKEVFERVVRRILTEGEAEYCFAKPDPYPCVAARFCAKEAFAKALGIENPASVPFKDVEVLGKPPRLVARGGGCCGAPSQARGGQGARQPDPHSRLRGSSRRAGKKLLKAAP